MKLTLHKSDTAVPTAAITDTEATAVWEKTIDPDGVGQAEAIARDLASFTGEPVEDVLCKMSEGRDRFKELWQETSVDPGDPASVSAFYREQFVEAYELADWHCGRANGTPPLNYARVALFAQKNGLKRVLDFGSGIGTGSLCFAKAGCEVYSADVAQMLLKLVDHRLRRHGHTPRLIDLNEASPPPGYFDIITAFDVLEHIPDQLATVKRLQSHLRVGGRLFVNLMIDSSDPERPMHVSSAGNWLRMMRQTSLVPDWANFFPGMQVFVRRRSGRFVNYAGSWVDWAEGK